MIRWNIYSNMEVFNVKSWKEIPSVSSLCFFLSSKIHLHPSPKSLDVPIYSGVSIKSIRHSAPQLCLCIYTGPFSHVLCVYMAVVYLHGIIRIYLYSIDSYSAWAIFYTLWMFNKQLESEPITPLLFAKANYESPLLTAFDLSKQTKPLTTWPQTYVQTYSQSLDTF